MKPVVLFSEQIIFHIDVTYWFTNCWHHKGFNCYLASFRCHLLTGFKKRSFAIWLLVDVSYLLSSFRCHLLSGFKILSFANWPLINISADWLRMWLLTDSVMSLVAKWLLKDISY